MKKIGVLFILVLCISLCGCSSFIEAYEEKLEEQIAEEELSSDFGSGMEKLYQSGNFAYFREPTTDVMYLCLKAGYAGGLTVMMDPETGLPLTYTRYMEMAESAVLED